MRALRSLLHPRRLLKRRWVRAFGDYETQIKLEVVPRPHYGYCLFHAARLAVKLGIRRISALEFGVAGGNGLLNLEHHARKISRLMPIEIEIYGFDTGEGLPKPVDYRDLPYHWKEGFYRMDVAALRAKLTKAKLVLGNVSETLAGFCESNDPAPIGAISFDLDFYSSTKSALRILKSADRYLLPRIYCYFDDTIGSEIELYSDFTGQRLAIGEFNQENETIKLGFPYCLMRDGFGAWRHQIWIAHLFRHPQYDSFVSNSVQQLPLSGADA